MQKLFALLIILLLPLAQQTAVAQGGGQVTVTGTVTASEDNSPLIGVSVIAGPTNGTTTLADGRYSIKVAAGTVLTFQYVGYEAVQFTVPQNKTQVTHNIALKSDAQVIGDVVVIAYGVRKKGTVAGSVSAVKSERIENVPTPSFDQALQGQVTGLSVMSNSGDPSAAATFVIRGTNSINSGTAPLFILDGVPISNSDFNTISPNDIENVSVLKDASSTSIYGARAANGVVIITSKRGKMADHPTITFRAQAGFSQIAHGNWDLMNTAERIQYEQEVGLNEGMDYSRLRSINTNWLKEVFNDYAPVQNYDVSVGGANERFNYYVSANYYDQEGTAYNSFFNRTGMRANFDVKAAKWMKLGANTMFSYEKFAEADENQYTLVTPISAARFMLPYYSPYKADGSLASVNDGSWKGPNQNPLEWADNNPLSRKKYKLMITPFVEFYPIEGLVIRSQFGYDYQHRTSFVQSLPDYKPNNSSGMASRSSTDGRTLSITNTINYSFDANLDHHFTFMLGQEGIDYEYEGFSVATKGQNNNKLTNVTNGTIARTWSDVYSSYGYLSFFARGEYNYKNRYFVELAARTDASSRFGADNRWGRFWSAGFMWNLRNEKFMEGLDWLTDAEFKVSTGTSGNSSIPNYDHLALITGGADYVGDAGVYPMQKGNEELSWETTWTTNVALNLGFYNRLNVGVEFYNKKTTDVLMSVPTNASNNAGIQFEWQNVGAIVNRGMELTLNATAVRTKNFAWVLNANVSYNKNKLVELYNGVNSYEYGNTSTKLVVGHTTSDFYMNRFAGVNPDNGDALWYTADGKLTNELKDSDKVMVGKSALAPWMGGFGTNLSWKGFSLSAQFSWVEGRYMVNNDRYFDESNGRFSAYNQSKRLLKRWKQPGDITDIPRDGVYSQFDTRLLEDASFLRLKNMMLSWTMPEKWIKATRVLRSARIYAQAQNLFTFTKFTGLDPEGTSNMYQAQYPMSRQFTFGVDLTF